MQMSFVVQALQNTSYAHYSNTFLRTLSLMRALFPIGKLKAISVHRRTTTITTTNITITAAAAAAATTTSRNGTCLSSQSKQDEMFNVVELIAGTSGARAVHLNIFVRTLNSMRAFFPVGIFKAISSSSSGGMADCSVALEAGCDSRLRSVSWWVVYLVGAYIFYMLYYKHVNLARKKAFPIELLQVFYGIHM